jgi:tRNA threonylcarbamoyl adenosine modification protein YeaZ
MNASLRYGLALHTTTPDLGLALSDFSQETRSQVLPLGRSMAAELHLYLAEFLQPQSWQDLSFIAVAAGPGGFTGTRLGVVTARTLAQQLQIPLFPVSTLAAIALMQRQQDHKMGAIVPAIVSDPPEIFAVEMKANRGQLFGGIYRFSEANSVPEVLLQDAVFSPEAWQHQIQVWPESHRQIRVEADEILVAASVTALLEIAYGQWQRGDRPHWITALPFYGQQPV